ncbi:YfhO family protein [Spirosoma sp. KUDC1026]|uniref:YfhO family protein n=1 Tax=Spirosoma sp. KUDC1026 TaxID=2745947 RepID=UPI00159BB82E|nr:YfhO family protein [Spirosoma sp. KUDC1026]QKZ15076.1 YfhO family protein [Spirosoma sp. KUDC1026]
MNQPTLSQPHKRNNFLPHLIAVLGLLLLAIAYFSPVMQGKTLSMADVQQSTASAREIRDIAQQTGEKPLWTDAVFSGMPGYMIDFNYPNIWVYKATMAVINVLPNTANVVFVLMLSTYLLLVVLGCNPWLSAMGAIAYGFGTFGIVSLEAGHISKIYAMAYGSGILAGVILCLRGRYWLGAALTGYFFCMELGANHIQITYYLFMAIGLYVLIEGIALVRAGQTRRLAMGLTVLVLAGVLAAGSFGKRLLIMNQYTKETIRGTSELTEKTTNPDGKSAGNVAKSGLDKDYAFSYSYGKAETLTLLVPNAFGGSSGGGLSTDSEFYKTLTEKGVDPASAKQFAELGAPTYWGDQPMVGGPAYAGAVLLFLFVLSMFVIRTPIRWWLLSAAVLMIALAQGKNLAIVNYTLFDYLPYFNKFRAMTMALCLAQLFLGIGAALGIQTIVNQKLTFAQIKQPLLISFALTGGLALVLILLGGSLFSFQTPTDLDSLSRYFGEAAKDFQTALIRDRQALLRSDAIRSFIFIVLAAGAVWAFVTNKIKAGIFYPVLLALLVVDLFGVDKRFLNNADFVSKTQVAEVFQPTPADEQILQDKSLGYRVFDQTVDFMNSNRTSYFHRSIGGYHAAKLRRYQELVTYAFQPNTLNILNMLNAKYVIQGGQPDPANPQQQSGPVALPNPEVMGAAWFVGNVRQVNNADEEIAAMKTLSTRDSAVVDKRFATELGNLPAVMDHTGSTIQLTSYRPDKLVYQANATRDGLAVFSEIYYRGNEDWQATIDGKPAPHLRANYVLRAMRIPAGKHTIEFTFSPPLNTLGNTIDLIFNVLLIALIAFVIFRATRNRQTEPELVPEPVIPFVPESPKAGPKTKTR